MNFSFELLYKLSIKYKKQLIIIIIITSTIGLLLTLIIPKRYKSSGVFFILNNNDSSLSSNLLNNMNIILGEQNTSTIAVDNLLSTRFVMDNVIQKNDLMNYLKTDKKYKAYFWLKEHVKLNQYKDGTNIISCYDNDKNFAAEIVNTYLSLIDSFYRESNIFVARNYRKFLEKRIVEIDKKVKIYSDSLVAFQKKNNIVIPEDEFKIFYENVIVPLQKSLMEQKINYLSAKDISDNLISYKDKKKIYDITLKELDNIYSHQTNFSKIPLKDFPAKIQEYMLLYTNLKLNFTLYNFVKTEYENALLKEKKDTPSIYIIDKGIPAEIAYFPRKRDGLILGFLIGLFISYIYILYKNNENIT